MRRIALAAAIAAAFPAVAVDGQKALGDIDFFLTVLHFNDGESELLGSETAGGVGRFTAKMRDLTFAARNYSDMAPSDFIVLSSGDNFLAGPEFSASLDLPETATFYDAQALFLAQAHVSAIGNHEFDFGPDVLARFVDSIPVTFVSANLDFTNEPSLQALADRGEIRPSTVVTRSGRRIGVVGATTDRLPTVSSPRNTIVSAPAAAIQAEVDALLADGVEIIILISHLQNIEEDLALIPQLRGIDVAIAGGGDELLANPGNPVVPGDEGEIFGPYPVYTADADNRFVPIITGSGGYNYIGRLILGFSEDGEIMFIDTVESGPQRVVSPVIGPDGVNASNSPFLPAAVTIEGPVLATVSELIENVVAQSEVPLNGVRGQVRTRETNLGNLIADSLLDAANDKAAEFGIGPASVAFQNGGGIRNDAVIPAGPITEFDTFSIVPFANFVSIVPDITPADLKALLENAYSAGLTDAGELQAEGRFAQIAGMTVEIDLAGVPFMSRVVSATLDDGTVLIQGGQPVGGPSINVATINFLASGGDAYPFPGAPDDPDFVSVGVTYQQALQGFIQENLGGTITAADYPEGGEGRIVQSGG